jgi:hypothetical protein
MQIVSPPPPPSPLSKRGSLLRPKLDSIENRLQATRVQDDDDGSETDVSELEKQGKWMENNHDQDDDMELVLGSQESVVVARSQSRGPVGSNKRQPVLHGEIYRQTPSKA